MANVLEVEDLTVRLDGTTLFRGLGFNVPRGSLLAIIGPNGVGKTVLFRALIGAISHEGSIRWAPGTKMGYVPQKLDIQRGLPLTGGELLRAKARVVRVSRGDIDQTLSHVGLGPPIINRPIGSLSSGYFQRLIVALALLGRPDVLLLDEATAGVDEPGQERLNEVIRRLHDDEGTTVLLISHDLSLVYRSATHVLCLGREHACFGAPRNVLTERVLNEIYGTPMGFDVHDDARS